MIGSATTTATAARVRRVGSLGTAAALILVMGPTFGIGERATGAPLAEVARRVEPVVLTGSQLPAWSRSPAIGVANPDPPGPETDLRTAHNGTVTAPPDTRTGADVDDIAAFAWDGTGFVEIPVQVDERFPYFLVNGRSGFDPYSGTDTELTYEWDVESWKMTAGVCDKAYPETDPAPMQDPVGTLDDDDEVVFMASDAGARAPSSAPGPPATTGQRYEVRLGDPLDPSSDGFVYLFERPGGSSFTHSNGYVDYERDADADEWIDRHRFTSDDPEKLGTSNTGYGPNLEGTVCGDDKRTPLVTESQYDSSDRFPRDGVTVTTDTYRWRATGRWMVRGMQVTKPEAVRDFGPDLVDRWKGRAFQQSPDSDISLVGFEDEQVNWEANSSLLGELRGPVRAIREVWGADSGTNVTKTETFYRDLVVYRYRVRVHPIPPDGLYTSWDYNHDAVSTYYNETKTSGVPIDGRNDDVGQVDRFQGCDVIDDIRDCDAFFDAPDPTFTKPLSFMNWEQVSGNADNGSLVYMFQINNPQAFENPPVVPYYRDDACLDDGTGDDPSPRLFPGEALEDTPEEYRARPCYTRAPEGYTGPYRQGAFGSHGIHYFFTGDTDNAFTPAPVTEVDGQQYQWAAPTAQPTNVGDRYANTAKFPLVASTSLQGSEPGKYSTDIDITGPTTGQVTDRVTLRARLTSEGRPVPGQRLSFRLRGHDRGSAITDENGVARHRVKLSRPAERTTLTVAYSGTDENSRAETTTSFHIRHEDTTMRLRLDGGRRRVFAMARLLETENEKALPKRLVYFYVEGERVAAARTGPDGRALVAIPRSTARTGDTLRAAFGGGPAYAAAERTRRVPPPG